MRFTVAYYTDSSTFGGVEQALLHLIAGLDYERWRPVLIHHGGTEIEPLLTQAKRLGAELRLAPHMPLGLGGARRIPAFLHTLRSERPEVFHAHLSWPLACKYGLVAALLNRIPVVVATSQLFLDIPYTAATRLQMRAIFSKLDRVFAVSQAIAAKLHTVFDVRDEKMRIVHNAIAERNSFAPAEEHELCRRAKQHKIPLVFTAARLEEQKGLQYLIQAAVQVPDAIFAVAGEGSQREELESLVNQLGLKERFFLLGFRNDIDRWLTACDLFVLPSLYEGLPLSILEAMSMGKPVIASDIPGNDEAILHGQTGLLVKPQDPAGIAQGIKYLLQNPGLSKQLGLSGQSRVRSEFSAENMVARITSTYEEILVQKRVSRAKSKLRTTG